METIRNYLETMFNSLPNTPEVQRAKDELLQMMEDKYTELIEEGKTENEAVGRVISEFGNLEELAESLGIHQVIHETQTEEKQLFTLEEVKQYLHDHARHAFLTALGVAFCILSIMGIVIGEAFAEVYDSEAYEVAGVTAMFLLIAAGIGFLVYSGVMIGKWNYLKKESYFTDFSTTEYINQMYENSKSTFVLQLTIGIALIIISFLPAMIGEAMDVEGEFYENMGMAFMFFIVAVGVFLIVMSTMKSGSLKSLLKLNNSNTVGGSYVKTQKEVQYHNHMIESLMSVYWYTVTCLYLMISFLTFRWWTTWIIWPIAGIIEEILKKLDKSL